ncbi:MAG: hypothetical protein Q8P45_02150 [Candidatus Harrisonbacteria bacterium]|nr:hypothetical protein [Candidatus Harrisonbacteria bacterium]
MADIQSVNKKETLPSQDFVEVKAIKDGVVVLKNGALRQIVMVSGMNFDLKSEEEQESIVAGYQNFLNSLDFSIQIFVHTRKLNIDRYIDGLNKLELQEGNPLLRNQIGEYREFIRSFVSENAIMNKTFFVVIPFDPVQLPQAGKKTTKKLFRFLSKEKTTPAVSGEEEAHIEQYMRQLAQRSDQVISGLNQLGLRAIPLNEEESTELFYNLYNPTAVEKKGLEIANTKESLEEHE